MTIQLKTGILRDAMGDDRVRKGKRKATVVKERVGGYTVFQGTKVKDILANSVERDNESVVTVIGEGISGRGLSFRT